jgi:Flp pilus assembly protein TadG
MSKTKIVVRQGERGNYMIEFGLSIVLFFGIVLGILDVSRGIYAYNFLAGAAKEGSRYAMIHGSSSGSKASSTDIQNVVQKWLIGMADSSATVTTTWSPATENPGSQVTVKVQYTFTPMSNFLVGSWNLQSTSQTTVIQ